MSFSSIKKKKISPNFSSLRKTFIIEKMNIKKQNIDSFAHLIGAEEDSEYQKKLLSSTIFPYMHLFNEAKCLKAVLNFSLKEVSFNKKKALIFFLAIELLTNQKCVATLSSKNVLA